MPTPEEDGGTDRRSVRGGPAREVSLTSKRWTDGQYTHYINIDGGADRYLWSVSYSQLLELVIAGAKVISTVTDEQKKGK